MEFPDVAEVEVSGPGGRDSGHRLDEVRPLTYGVVFESPVRSGFLTPQGLNRNRNRSALSPEVKKTGPDRKKTADRGFNRSLDRSQSAPVLTGLRQVF